MVVDPRSSFTGADFQNFAKNVEKEGTLPELEILN